VAPVLIFLSFFDLVLGRRSKYWLS
jgi:hypothetical protein